MFSFIVFSVHCNANGHLMWAQQNWEKLEVSLWMRGAMKARMVSHQPSVCSGPRAFSARDHLKYANQRDQEALV